jgi:hypothetical protein
MNVRARWMTKAQAVKRLLRRRRLPRCPGCGRPLEADNRTVRDVGPAGIAEYHQTCAPSIIAASARQRADGPAPRHSER